ncbi:unnamed protein product [Laminaria digitata]
MASTDRDVLVALYNATDGAKWKHKTNWNTSAELRLWHGIEVNGQGRVVGLRLPANNLRGYIPKELGFLIELKELWLGENLLSGLIPPELENLAALTHLHLEGSQLSGPIPEALGALTKLETLFLSQNRLTGSIPKELESLSELQQLHLGSNQLTGPIPEALGALTKLETLFLSQNQLTGSIPKELGGLSELRQLHLGSNQLTGETDPNRTIYYLHVPHLRTGGVHPWNHIEDNLKRPSILPVSWLSWSHSVSSLLKAPISFGMAPAQVAQRTEINGMR